MPWTRDDFLALVFFVGTVVLGLGLGILIRAAHGQEHQHGVDGLPDWYDPGCCNQQDCRPVPDDELGFGLNASGEPIVWHRPTGLEFTKNKWRNSQDERYHVCFRPWESGDGFTGYCVYLRAGA